MSYRDLEELLLSSGDMCRVLELRAVPDYSTFNRVYNRVSGKRIQKLLEKTLEVIGIGMANYLPVILQDLKKIVLHFIML